MADVAQEANNPVAPVAAETETSTPAFSVEAVVEGAKELVKDAVAEVKTVANAVVEEVKAVEQKLKIEISDAEKIVVLRQENQFLQLTTQARELQKQIESLQKNFPEYVKSLAKKYALEIKDYTFNSVEGVFHKNQKQ